MVTQLIPSGVTMVTFITPIHSLQIFGNSWCPLFYEGQDRKLHFAQTFHLLTPQK